MKAPRFFGSLCLICGVLTASLTVDIKLLAAAERATSGSQVPPARKGAISLELTLTFGAIPEREKYVERTQSVGAARAQKLLYTEIASALSLANIRVHPGDRDAMLQLSVHTQLGADVYTRYSPDNLASPRLSGSATIVSPTRQRLWTASPYDYILTGLIWQMSGPEMMGSLSRGFVRGHNGLIAQGLLGALSDAGAAPKITKGFVNYLEAGGWRTPVSKVFEQDKSNDNATFNMLVDALLRISHWQEQGSRDMIVKTMAQKLSVGLSVNQRLTVVRALAKIGGAEAQLVLSRIASDDSSMEVRSEARRSLEK